MMNAVKINGQVMHFRVDGPESGAPVLLANSLGTDLRVWDHMLAQMPCELRFIRYDKRGHGLSEGPDAPYFMGDLVKDAGSLLDHLNIKNAVVVGLSIGGMIAQGLAAERPDLVKAMVLMDTGAKIGTPGMWEERVAALRDIGLVGMADAVLERWVSKSFREEKPEELALWRSMLTRTTTQGYAGCALAIAETDLRDSTARLTLPTMAIAGSEDGATPPDLVRETAALIDGASFHIIRGAGHLPCVEEPTQTAALITRFLEEVGHV